MTISGSWVANTIFGGRFDFLCRIAAILLRNGSFIGPFLSTATRSGAPFSPQRTENHHYFHVEIFEITKSGNDNGSWFFWLERHSGKRNMINRRLSVASVNDPLLTAHTRQPQTHSVCFH
jgi:hypothetical protein